MRAKNGKTTTKAVRRELIPKMLYLPQSVCDQIERYAESEGRRFGNMGRRLVEEALEARREPATANR